MEKFIGREKELRELEIRFSSDAFEFIVIYGRRRVGKTMLIEQSINNRRCIFLQGTSNLKYNLEELSNQVFSLYPEYQGLIKFNSYQDFFRFLSVKTKDESLIVVCPLRNISCQLLLCNKLIRSCFRRIILNRLKGAVNITKTSMMGLKKKNFSLLKVSFCSTNHNRVIVAATSHISYEASLHLRGQSVSS